MNGVRHSCSLFKKMFLYIIQCSHSHVYTTSVTINVFWFKQITNLSGKVQQYIIITLKKTGPGIVTIFEKVMVINIGVNLKVIISLS